VVESREANVAVVIAWRDCGIRDGFKGLYEVLELSVGDGGRQEANTDCYVEVGLVGYEVCICTQETQCRFAFDGEVLGWVFPRTAVRVRMSFRGVFWRHEILSPEIVVE